MGPGVGPGRWRPLALGLWLGSSRSPAVIPRVTGKGVAGVVSILWPCFPGVPGFGDQGRDKGIFQKELSG